MAQVLHMAGLGVMLLCFARISYVSYAHFDRARSDIGMLAIRVLSLGATAWLGVQAAWFADADSPLSGLLTLGMAACAIALLEETLRQTAARYLDVAFTDRAPDALLTEGVYRVTRNPFYASYLIYWSAWIPASGGSWIAVAALVFFGAVYGLAARAEERVLAAKFGQTYADYKSRTGRFIPRLTPQPRKPQDG